MTTPTAPVLLLDPKIPTGNRSVFPKGKPPTPFIFGLSLLPAMGFGIALSDDRLGFKLFMAGIAVAMMVLVVALYLWTQALTAGVVRIDSAGALRFVPPSYLRKAFYAVAIGLLVPGAISLTVTLLDLPTMQGSTRFTTAAPYALAIISIVALVKLVGAARIPEGLSLTPEGLSGVRGGSRVDIKWDDLVSASVLGEHGPKLTLLAQSKGSASIDAHYLGSDPAVVVKVIEYFRQNPAQREMLADGRAAIRAVEAASR